jgi:hypothetical protein
MRIVRIVSRHGRELVAVLILAAFGMHALVPEGFMPGGGRLSIEICPDGFPTYLLAHGAHHHHGGSPAHAEHCAFATAGSGGPLPQFSAFADAAVIQHVAAMDVLSVATTVHPVHLPQPRAPPPLPS